MMEFPSSSSKQVNDEEMVVGTDEMVVTEEMNIKEEEQTVETQLSVPLPSMRGKLMSDGTLNICRGVWAMNDAAHEIPDQCSDFEFKLVKANDLAAGFPFSGKWQGWFHVQQPPPAKPLKVQDKDMNITFVPNDNGWSVEGYGGNTYGKFRLRGTLGSDHMLHIYREYQVKPVPAPRKRPATTAGLEGSTGSGPDGALLPPPKKVAPARDTTVKRDRKPSLTISDPSAVTVFTRPSSTKHATAGSSSSAAIAMDQGNGRPQRPPPHVQKCQEVLKDMTKYPQAVWFGEPVDYIKLNLHDYPSIIKHPMDFRTIKTNLESGMYASADAFANHMRLVFQNAMTYNQQKDNPVHVAANELSLKFEERYRQMLVSLNRSSDQGQGLGPTTTKSSSSQTNQTTGRKSMSAAVLPSKGISGVKTSKQQPGGISGGSVRAKSTGPGPRPPPGGGASTYGLPPPAVDGSTEVFFAMKRQMDEMANELKTLRTKVMHSGGSGGQDGGSSHPLTMTEKKTLVKDVQKLIAVPELLTEVIRILSENGIDTSSEVDFECMPTRAQRMLQTLVVNQRDAGAGGGKAGGSKKPQQPAGGVKKSASAATVKSTSGVGRPSKQQTSSSSSSSTATSSHYNYPSLTDTMAVGAGVDPLAHLGDDADADVLLFPTEDLEELRADTAAAGGTGGEGIVSDDEEEEETTEQAVDTITVTNASAWNVKPTTTTTDGSATATTHPPAGRSSVGGSGDGGDEWSAAAVELQAQQQRQEERKDEGARLAAAKRAAEEERIRALRYAAQHQAEEARQREEEEAQQKAADEAALWARRDAERTERERLVKTVELDHNDLALG